MSKSLIGEHRELTYRAMADPTRRHLLRLLDDRGAPTHVADLATQVGLHRNTVRGHLERLRLAGLVTRSAEKRTRPGRPRMLYEATPPETRSPGSEGYRFLAEVLAGYMQANLEDPAAAAEAAGYAWGRYMVDEPDPFVRAEASSVVGQIVDSLAEFGFEPRREREGSRIVVTLHDCPFREVARARSDVVCSVHLGLIRGMAEKLGSVTVDGLQPFVEPSLCVATLSLR